MANFFEGVRTRKPADLRHRDRPPLGQRLPHRLDRLSDRPTSPLGPQAAEQFVGPDADKANAMIALANTAPPGSWKSERIFGEGIYRQDAKIAEEEEEKIREKTSPVLLSSPSSATLASWR